MNTLKKRAVCLLLAAGLCLGLLGCGGQDTPDTTPGAETTERTEPSIPTEPSTPTEPENMTQPEHTDLPVTDAPGMVFAPVDEKVTAKIEVNLRNIPSQGEQSQILHTLKNGETVKRTGVSETGWSELSWKGKTCYAVSSYLTTDLDYKPPVQIQTPFKPVDEEVTPKDAVNLRTLPSTTHPEVEVVVKLESGQVIKRTGINEDVGWSRVEYKGQTLYCISSYLRLYEQADPAGQTQPQDIPQTAE